MQRDKDIIADQTFGEIMDRGLDVINEWLEKKHRPHPKQAWSVINARTLKNTWRHYAKYGFVRREKDILSFQQTIIENVGKLYANTIFMGHEPIPPVQHAQDLGVDLADEDLDGFDEFVTDDRGSWRISDYAIGKLTSKAIQIAQADTPEKKLVLMSQLLNIVHMRSDLASWFIEGGTITLNDLAYN